MWKAGVASLNPVARADDERVERLLQVDVQADRAVATQRAKIHSD
jgi:hypothetical protein